MDEIVPASIARRVEKLKGLARKYFVLPKGAFIESHAQLIRVFDIRGSKHRKKHPHRMKRVYISRRALKHFVESRKVELLRNHEEEEALRKIEFALGKLQEAITDFDVYEFEPPHHFYVKDYASEGNPPIRVLVQEIDDRLEIQSVHFTKRRKKT